MARKLGISTLKDYTYYGPSLVLGGGEVTLLELTSAYSIFANQGLKNSPTAILKIEDSEGTIVEKHRVMSKRVLSSESTDLLTDVLSDNQARTPMFGPNSSLYIDDQTAAKTGTTQNYNDAWTIGYNNQIVVGVWVGNNDNSPMAKQPGVVLAAPIWKTFMLQVKR
jgi:membrane peptidoglycan carboxypeptidase